MHRPAILYALASAALFGVTTPAAKILLGAIDPIVLAGLLYCGAGIGVALLRRIARGTLQESDAPQVALSRKDVPWLAGAITAGGIAGPLLLMFGLAQTDAATASFLLALEGAATALIAWFVFHENFDRRIALGMVCIVAGAITLAWSGKPTLQNITGPVAIIGACRSIQCRDWPLGWRIDHLISGSASRGHYGFFGIWRKLGALCCRASALGCSADWRLLFDSAVPWSCSLYFCSGRKPHARSRYSGRTHGDRCLAARDRVSRT